MPLFWMSGRVFSNFGTNQSEHGDVRQIERPSTPSMPPGSFRWFITIYLAETGTPPQMPPCFLSPPCNVRLVSTSACLRHMAARLARPTRLVCHREVKGRDSPGVNPGACASTPRMPPCF